MTYPDGTEDHVTVPVTTNEQADNDAYQPTTDEVTKDYGTPTTEEDVTGAVTYQIIQVKRTTSYHSG